MTTWEPILDGDLAENAWDAIRDVADAISGVTISPVNAGDIALFWAYVADALENERSAYAFDKACAALCESLPTFKRLGLHRGLAGAAWVISHISEPGSADDVLIGADKLLASALDVDRWPEAYDLIHGLVGFSIYFLERVSPNQGLAIRALERIVDHLIASSETTPDGVTWHTSPQLLQPWQRVAAPRGYFNCGLAHGVPGVVAVLGRMRRYGDARVESICAQAMRWIRAQLLPDLGAGTSPEFTVRDGGSRPRARTAWCYGDPGVAIAGWSAAHHLCAPKEEWLRLAAAAATRDASSCAVVDPCLCHGAAGLAHMFNRFYQATGDGLFRDAARSWFSRALAMRTKDGLGGFTSPSKVAPGWTTSASLLDGSIGVALSLLAGVRAVEPNWDRLLLCDLPLLRES